MKRAYIDPSKANTIVNWEQPKNSIEVHNFLGLMSYYPRFMQDFSIIAFQLTKLLRKNVKID